MIKSYSRLFTCSIRNFSSKKSTTQRYILRQAKDEFAIKAREHNYRARSAYKLLEINEKFRFLKPETVVVDVGCAPGSWLQVVVEECKLQSSSKGYALGIDLQNVLPIKGADILSMSDITHKETHEKIMDKLNGRLVDVVLSDMAPNPSGDNATDHLRLIQLCRAVFNLFTQDDSVFQISDKGVFICKIWDGNSRNDFMTELRRYFKTVKTIKPTACRDNSAELYLFCKNFNK